ncbi:putative ABC transport system permease protein [Dyadobacter sp. BE34]|uniref:ABC transport system permease protein n=1 Tax=Dyadobacter fermentans TaxID=94254 RepID=A0ABU1R6C0_9BACT|nr:MULTISPECIES: ABC transporter permease [Dyadobacter]MDR6808957.1 putative ABC transport system permease protein [Dyadobacter fermentans]MDR7046700.1 putative ABC transport system permease protein [Dyadobacter sp. BE242]MDR7201014.1 putative ABC transport system permease protein [Dyadobacter sp. BE34]MDR7218974.1 putative ABC transport system permease protein [Dyadobacter sp. BE31]MDR7264816.1 putative ABC transport system permease protein [Dyadobacter sp. BE32]
MLSNYIKIAWKVLLRHPFYTFITLFGITLTLTVLMVVTSFLDHLFGAHYPENKRSRSLYIASIVQTDSANTTMSSGPASFEFLTKYAKSIKSAERVAIMSNFSFSNAYTNGKRIKLNTKYTDVDFWSVTDFEFLEGKPYDETNIRNADHVAVITDALRDQYFGSDAETVVGKTIDIENINFRVIGVVKGSPPTRVYTYSDVYFPYTAPKSNYENKGIRGRFAAIVLTKNKGDLPAVQAEFDSYVSRIPRSEYSDNNRFNVLIVKADTYFDHFLNMFTRSEKDRIALYAIVGLVLLMIMGLPAVNLVNVNISRILERASEIGVRKAFGAPSKALLWQFIIENVFITFIGGAFALILTLVIIHFINSSGWIAYADLTINLPVFLVSVLVCLVFGLLSGVLPAFRMSKLKIAEALKA